MRAISGGKNVCVCVCVCVCVTQIFDTTKLLVMNITFIFRMKLVSIDEV